MGYLKRMHSFISALLLFLRLLARHCFGLVHALLSYPDWCCVRAATSITTSLFYDTGSYLCLHPLCHDEQREVHTPTSVLGSEAGRKGWSTLAPEPLRQHATFSSLGVDHAGSVNIDYFHDGLAGHHHTEVRHLLQQPRKLRAVLFIFASCAAQFVKNNRVHST